MPPHRTPAEKEFYVPAYEPPQTSTQTSPLAPTHHAHPAQDVAPQPESEASEASVENTVVPPAAQMTPTEVVLEDLEPDQPAPIRSLLDDTPVAVDSANPLLTAASGSRKETSANTRSWALAGVLLCLVLAAQGAYAFRAQLVQQFPPLRPVFVSICDWAGCSVSGSRDDSVLRIEASDLIESPGRAGRIQLTATLVNRGSVVQEYPALELKLTDNANQVQLSRILQPQDYLGRVPGKEEGLQPNAETFVNLNVEVTNRVQASGYGVRAFYP